MRIYMFWVHLNVINATKLPSMLLNVNLKGMVNVNQMRVWMTLTAERAENIPA